MIIYMLLATIDTLPYDEYGERNNTVIAYSDTDKANVEEVKESLIEKMIAYNTGINNQMSKKLKELKVQYANEPRLNRILQRAEGEFLDKLYSVTFNVIEFEVSKNYALTDPKNAPEVASVDYIE